MGSSDSKVLEIQINTEKVIKGAPPFCPMSSILKSNNSTCKIICMDWTGTGFFVSLPIIKCGNRLCGLVTNNHVLPQEQLLNGQNFQLIFDANQRHQTIHLSENRFRFTCQLLDITFVEFSPEELPSEVSFLSPSESITEKNTYAFITQHPLGGCCALAQGYVKKIWGFDLEHKISTEPGSSGSPLVDNDGNVIGIHKAGVISKNINKATDAFYLLFALRTLIMEKSDTSIGQAISNARQLSSSEKNELKEMGLKETSSPYVFISPASFGVTTLWFYRTNFGWFWTPEKPNSFRLTHLQDCNWSLVHSDFEIKAIGGFYDQEKPAKRNVQLIECLADTGLRYNI